MPSQGGRLVALLSCLVREFSIEVVESHSDVKDVSEAVRQVENYVSIPEVFKEARLAGV